MASDSAPAFTAAIPDAANDHVAPSTRRHICDQPMTLSNWYKQVNWLSTTLIIFIPMIGFASAFYTPLQTKTAVFAVIYYFFSGLGITAGYHRLWAHRCYKAALPLKIFLIIAGSAAVEGSARWWSRDHRSHHRYTDTDKDPYSVRKGLLYSHLGWMVLKQNPKRIGRTNISDLNADSVVVWQHKNYLKAVLVSALGIPILVCGLGWGDWWGGLVYAGILRVCFVQQATFCVNSLAHWLGEQPFDDRASPRDHVITALVTLGEGYHNYHHEFPTDYRNGIEWWQYDPTKWFIWVASVFGLATHLKTFSANAVEQGRLQQLQKKLDQKRVRLDWGTPLSKLPQMKWDDYKERCEKGERLIAIGGVVHDVTNFISEHPGGEALISSGCGQDATAMFNGGVYDHNNAAHNLLSTMRVGVLTGGCEVEILKRAHAENKDVALSVDSFGNEIVRGSEQITRVPQPLASAEAA